MMQLPRILQNRAPVWSVLAIAVLGIASCSSGASSPPHATGGHGGTAASGGAGGQSGGSSGSGGSAVSGGQTAGGGNAAREHNDRAIEAHFDLQVALRSAVIGAGPRRGGGEGIGHRVARGGMSNPAQAVGYERADFLPVIGGIRGCEPYIQTLLRLLGGRGQGGRSRRKRFPYKHNVVDPEPGRDIIINPPLLIDPFMYDNAVDRAQVGLCVIDGNADMRPATRGSGRYVGAGDRGRQR